jgi:hypothetical protein
MVSTFHGVAIMYDYLLIALEFFFDVPGAKHKMVKKFLLPVGVF